MVKVKSVEDYLESFLERWALMTDHRLACQRHKGGCMQLT